MTEQSQAAVAAERVQDTRPMHACTCVDAEGRVGCRSYGACEVPEAQAAAVSDAGMLLHLADDMARQAVEFQANDTRTDEEKIRAGVDFISGTGSYSFLEADKPVQAPVGGGWQLVPKEPTDEMRLAFFGSFERTRYPGGRPSIDFIGAYRAMLAAAPGAAEQPEVSLASHVMRDGKLVNVWDAAPQAPEVGVEPLCWANPESVAHLVPNGDDSMLVQRKPGAKYSMPLYTASQLPSLKESHDGQGSK